MFAAVGGGLCARSLLACFFLAFSTGIACRTIVTRTCIGVGRGKIGVVADLTCLLRNALLNPLIAAGASLFAYPRAVYFFEIVVGRACLALIAYTVLTLARITDTCAVAA